MDKKVYTYFMVPVLLLGVFYYPPPPRAYGLDCYEEIAPEYLLTDPETSFHIAGRSDVNQLRRKIIKFLWGSPKLPKRLPDQILINIPTPPYIDTTDMSNLSSIDQYTVTMASGVQSVVYHLHPEIGNEEVVIVHQGHAPDLKILGLGEMIRDLINSGYAVLAFHMPLFGPNLAPPGITHDNFAMLESDTLNPLSFFVEPVTAALNYSLKEYDYDDAHMIGLSGGGWTTVLYAAIDKRIKLSFPVAGSWPMYLREPPCSNVWSYGDYEQGKVSSDKVKDFFANTASYLDLHVLGGYGRGRLQVNTYNKYDSCCFYGISYQTFEPAVLKKISLLKKGQYAFQLDVTHREHKISDWTRERIFDYLGP